MAMKVVLTPLTHTGKRCIGISFTYNFELKEYLKRFKGVRWSKTHRCFYLPYTPTSLESFWDYLNAEGYTVDRDAFALPPKNKRYFHRKKGGLLPELTADNQRIHESYLKYLRGKRYSESTVNVYGGFVYEFLQFTGTKPTEQLTEDDVRLYVEWAVKTLHYAISTHRQLVGALKQFAFFYPACAIDAEKLQRPRKDRKLPTVLSKEEVFTLLRVTRNLKHRTLLALLYSSGLRVGELIGLKLPCFD